MIAAMKLGSVMVVVALGGAWASNLGCSHEAKPAVAPDEPPPPLPPASGTTIGLLVDHASELALNDDQTTQLRAISDELATQLAVDDGALRVDPNGPPPPEQTGRGFGVRTGVRTGARPAGGASGGAEAFPSAPTGWTQDISGTTVGAVQSQRAQHQREAIGRALALLDAGQKTSARRLLAEHGVDPDTGEVTGAQPGVAPPLEDPKPGQPLPRAQ